MATKFCPETNRYCNSSVVSLVNLCSNENYDTLKKEYSDYAKKVSEEKIELENELKVFRKDKETCSETIADNNKMSVEEVNSDPEMSNDFEENLKIDENSEGNF